MLVRNVAKHVRKYTKIPLAKYVLCLMLPTINASINYTKSPSIRKLIAKPVILNLKVYLNFWVLRLIHDHVLTMIYCLH